MNEACNPAPATGHHSVTPQQPTIVVQTAQPPARRRVWFVRLLLLALASSALLNAALYSSFSEYFTNVAPPTERFHSGDSRADAKIVLLKVTGTLMPPFTGRILKKIQRATEDNQVRAVVLVIDSPGGLVADSHQIYHSMEKLRRHKPIYVAMKRMAASGGLYIAMGAGEKGKIFAEPTTWTGSIGVIIPRYDISKLAEKLGVVADSLKTGEFKDSLSPFRPLSDEERQLWDAIIGDALERFLHVISDNRSRLDYETVKTKLATGQVFTAAEALENGLIDEIGYEEDVIEAMRQELGLETVRVVTYEFPTDLLDLLTGLSAHQQQKSEWQNWLDATVPRAMYFCSWGVGIAGFE